MGYNVKEIKKGIKLHCIDSNKFKTNLIAVIITLPLNKKTVTFDALIPAVLKRGSQNLKSQEEISKKLENMYGAVFDCGVEKHGDNHILKFYLESLNDKFVLESNRQNMVKESLNLLFDIIFNPFIQDNQFREDYVQSEKNNIKLLIKSKINNKDKYALNRCIEEMYKNKPFGLYKYGYIEDLEQINSNNLYNYYIELINKSKIDIYISGELDKEKIMTIVENNENIKKLKARETEHIINPCVSEFEENTNNEVEIKEQMDVLQGKLVVGLDLKLNDYDSKFKASMYNIILGEGAHSKLFQNVREKASLAYTTGSNYIRQKNSIFIRCGIEIENYDKTLKIIKKQLEDMQNGHFTEEDLKNARKYIISGLQSMQDEQDSEIIYYMGQELSGRFISFEKYIKKIEKITMQDVQDIASNVNINTIYFLTK